ncbi:MAG: hypothetical protein IT381_26485 [Deltaproteobacteria bacterium]|nr:hypothetical protein [Deltaproteobacteria bacterium]
MAHAPKTLNPADLTLPDPTFVKLRNMALGAALVGLVLTGVGAAQAHGQFFFSYLIGFFFWLTIALGGLFFVLVQHLTRSGWSVVVRRLAEAIASTLPFFAVLFLPIIAFGMHDLYSWTHEGHVSASKAKYLNTPFFIVRALIYFGVWSFASWRLRSFSYTQDQTGDPALTAKAQGFAPGATLLFALTVSFAGIDWIMSLQPHWFSTIFGVYIFAGSAIAIFSTLSLCCIMLMRLPAFEHVITEEHLHMIGKFLFGFTVFWAYIAFSQFMLIWYANIPEETEFFLHRFHNGWENVSALLLFGQFILAFLILLPRGSKRTPGLLAFGAIWQLVFHYVDLFWLVAPMRKLDAHSTEFAPAGIAIGDIGALLLVGGIFAFLVVRKLKSAALVPHKDPRLEESLMAVN